MLVGLALRVAAAQGGVWTDEAWSVIYAAQARDPLGIFLRINHDNNHHLNSLWLQAIGPGGAPMLLRLPAIVSGVLCIPIAALMAGRRSNAAGLVAALLFTITPILVVFGSEARGYSMMLLAALLLLLLVSDALDGRPAKGAPWWLAVLAVLGMFSHLTMAAAIGIATMWFYLERRDELGPKAAMPATLRLMGPALVATGGVVAFVFAAAELSPLGLRIGGYEPFAGPHFASALDDVALWSVGLGSPWPWVVPVAVGAAAVIIAFRRPEWLGSRARFYALLILTVPVIAGLVRAGNTGFARYYLAAALGLLLFVSEWLGRGLAGRPAVRAAAGLTVVAFVGASVYRDSWLISVARGRPAAALEDIATLSPNGARIAFAEPRLKAVVAVAAERTGYAARFAGGCTPADFLLAAQSRLAPLPPILDRCGVRMEAIDSSTTIPLTGDSWVLYRASSLQSLRSADSGRAPAAVNRRISVRAGVAQG
jgi:hypothetical protein